MTNERRLSPQTGISGIRVIRGSPCSYAVLRNELKRRLSAVGYQLSVTATEPSASVSPPEAGKLCALCGIVGRCAVLRNELPTAGARGERGIMTNCETNPISPTGLRSKDLGLNSEFNMLRGV